MRELEEREIKEIEESEKLTIEELGEKIKKLRKESRLYNSKLEKDIRTIGLVIKVKRVIDIYKKEGFEGVYAYALTVKRPYYNPEERPEYAEGDGPF